MFMNFRERGNVCLNLGEQGTLSCAVSIDLCVFLEQDPLDRGFYDTGKIIPRRNSNTT